MKKLIALLALIALIPPMGFAEDYTDPVDAVEGEGIEEVVEPSPPPIAGQTLHEHHPEVFIVPLGREMNLKVRYDHPMDFENNNVIESVQLEKLDGTFLGLKTYNNRAIEAKAEFLVNPALADFDQVMLVAKSSTHGLIKSGVNLKFTPAEELPDHLNPKKRRELAVAAAKKAKEDAARKAAKLAQTEVDQELKKSKKGSKKKKFGLF